MLSLLALDWLKYAKSVDCKILKTNFICSVSKDPN